ncbi:MAG: glucose-6-phosphate dehydrogenase [Candidatus Moranbacteria bacterium]|nr:glucose-6-phosphate dehydrogenase [Candidatus Moranbacteria bacterium]
MKTFILFGASGDLARQKLYAALFELYAEESDFRRIGFARTEMTNAEFREIVKESVEAYVAKPDSKKLEKFLQTWEYVSGSYDSNGIAQLAQCCIVGEVFYYLSIPSGLELIQGVVNGLAKNNLINDGSSIVLEKPFGFDFGSAKKINLFVQKHFKETQIYRIDHYLAKDLVQDMLALRFANPIFEPIWNGKYIEKIDIDIKEDEGIRSRGQYYDKAGAIKDMIQNHALQLLAFSTMDKPASLSAKSIHEGKNAILKRIKLWSESAAEAISIGQYDGYKNEPYVSPDSDTETLASIKVRIDSPKWRTVPVTITSGKKMDKKTTDITIHFKKNSKNIWEGRGCEVQNNIIHINVQPDNDIRLKLNSEYDASDKCAYPTELRFGFRDNKMLLKEPYENALRDLFAHDQSIFINSKEILLSWKFIDGVLEKIKPLRKKMLKKY